MGQNFRSVLHKLFCIEMTSFWFSWFVFGYVLCIPCLRWVFPTMMTYSCMTMKNRLNIFISVYSFIHCLYWHEFDWSIHLVFTLPGVLLMSHHGGLCDTYIRLLHDFFSYRFDYIKLTLCAWNSGRGVEIQLSTAFTDGVSWSIVDV